MTPSAADPPKIRVRELRWSDFDPLREMYLLLYEERATNPEIGIHLFAQAPSLADEVTWFANLYRRMLTGDAVVVVGELAGAVVGDCVIQRVGATAESEEAHLGTLGILVHRDQRGRGVGRALLRHALEQAKPKFDIVELVVLSVNVRARRLYEEFGFRFIGRSPRTVRRGDRELDTDLMVLELDGGRTKR